MNYFPLLDEQEFLEEEQEPTDEITEEEQIDTFTFLHLEKLQSYILCVEEDYSNLATLKPLHFTVIFRWVLHLVDDVLFDTQFYNSINHFFDGKYQFFTYESLCFSWFVNTKNFVVFSFSSLFESIYINFQNLDYSIKCLVLKAISLIIPNIYSNTNPECALKFVSILLEIYKPFFDIEDIDELTDPAIEWMFKLMDEYFNQTEENPFTINVQDELLDEFNKERDRLSNYFAQFEGSSEYEDSDIL